MSKPDKKTHSAHKANRKLWLNLLEDLPDKHFNALKKALLKNSTVFRKTDTEEKVGAAKGVLDLRLSDFKYTSEAFGNILRKFVRDNRLKVGARKVPVPEKEMASWKTLTRDYLARFVAHPPAEDLYKKPRHAKRRRARPSVEDDAKKAVEETARSIDSDDADNDDDGDHSLSVEEKEPPAKRQKLEDNPPVVQPAKQPKPDDEFDRFQVMREDLHILLMEQIEHAPTQSPDMQLSIFSSYYSMLSRDMSTLKKWEERIQKILQDYEADRVLAHQHMQRLWDVKANQ